MSVEENIIIYQDINSIAKFIFVFIMPAKIYHATNNHKKKKKTGAILITMNLFFDISALQ